MDTGLLLKYKEDVILHYNVAAIASYRTLDNSYNLLGYFKFRNSVSEYQSLGSSRWKYPWNSCSPNLEPNRGQDSEGDQGAEGEGGRAEEPQVGIWCL